MNESILCFPPNLIFPPKVIAGLLRPEVERSRIFGPTNEILVWQPKGGARGKRNSQRKRGAPRRNVIVEEGNTINVSSGHGTTITDVCFARGHIIILLGQIFRPCCLDHIRRHGV